MSTEEGAATGAEAATLPYRPRIGTLATSPDIDSINSLTPDNHGGNMDLPDMGPGSITYLPAPTPGARLFIGDAHRLPRRRRRSRGTAVACPSTTTIRVDLIKGWTLEWPRLENEFLIMAIGSTRPLEDATRIAYAELVRWMEAGVRLPPPGCLHDAQSVRASPPGQRGGPQVHRGCRHRKSLSRALIAHRHFLEDIDHGSRIEGAQRPGDWGYQGHRPCHRADPGG
jgi:hypothetical protein